MKAAITSNNMSIRVYGKNGTLVDDSPTKEVEEMVENFPNNDFEEDSL